LITDGRTDAQTGVTLNAPPPFFEWRGHKKSYKGYGLIVQCPYHPPIQPTYNTVKHLLNLTFKGIKLHIKPMAVYT